MILENIFLIWILLFVASIMFYCEIDAAQTLKERMLIKTEIPIKLKLRETCHILIISMGSFNGMIWLGLLLTNNYFGISINSCYTIFFASFFISSLLVLLFAFNCILIIYDVSKQSSA
jgi:hypothetical protein